jgi:hypothetical protein
MPSRNAPRNEDIRDEDAVLENLAGNWTDAFVFVPPFLQFGTINSLQPKNRTNQRDETYKEYNHKEHLKILQLFG